MADIMSTGLSGLMAIRTAIDTTGHNIANANTPGYARQSVDLATRPATPLGSGWVGNGVDVQTIQRNYNSYLTASARSADNSATQLQTYASDAEQLNGIFSNAANGIAAQFQRFQNAVQGVATAPASQAARQVLLGQAQTTATQLHSADLQLRSVEDQVNGQMTSDVATVNTLASGIARLNRDITAGIANTGQPPNDLLDQRDQLMNQLAQKVSVSSVPQDNGAINIFLGKGQALVLGETASTLAVGHDQFDANRPTVTLQGDAGAQDLTASLTGGSLGGALDFRAQMLDSARDNLGRIAVAFSDTVNAQQRAGLDQRGQLGSNLFSIGAAVAIAASGNTGSASVAIARSNNSALQDTDYVLQNAASGWKLTRSGTGATVTMMGSGTAADPFVADGFQVQVSGAAALGDRFMLRPTRDAVSGMSMALNSPAQIAAAAPILATANSANTGTAVTTAGMVVDATNAQLRQPVTLQFLTATTYSINGAGSFSYTSGQPISVNGWSIAISGTPAVGDRFNVTNNAAGAGDNRNALAMADSLNQPSLDGGTSSVNQAVTGLLGRIGVKTQSAQVNRDAQNAVRDTAVASRDNAQGVNLDEEAANLLRYQQAYQAMSQVIKVAGTLFDTLLNATAH